MSSPIDPVLSLLDLEDLEVNLFRGHSPQEDRQRVFGGQVLAQALVASGRTVSEDRSVHSLHAYFLRPGDPTVPIVYRVDRTREGRSFTTRRVTAIQQGMAIFHLESSFQRSERGLDHQDTMPSAPDPETLPTWREFMRPRLEASRKVRPNAEFHDWLGAPRPIDLRYVTNFDPFAPAKMAPRLLVWLRADGEVPGPPLQHQSVLAYASDLTLLDTALLPHGVAWDEDEYQLASLDHAMWFHRPFRADQWLLYVHESPVAAGARGISIGKLFTRDGQLVATAVQEGLIRPLDGTGHARG
ncbi:acyl-CoA thioesterase II [Myxococcota bacterium]|nr:acyl-CoA thioesterase II [Myxococcota bacterium]